MESKRIDLQYPRLHSATCITSFHTSDTPGQVRMEHKVDLRMRSIEDNATDSVGWGELGDYTTDK
jgi:hypothetical protein